MSECEDVSVVAQLPPLTAIPAAIAFWDARHGLLGTRAGAIELTTDGGRTFRVIAKLPSPLMSLDTAGAHGAIARLDGGEVLRTLDRGRHWRRFRLRYPTSFATPTVGLGVQTPYGGGAGRLVLAITRDGGLTWSRMSARPCLRAVSFSALVKLVTPRLGWLVCLGQGGAGNEEKAVFRTTDGGRSWRTGAAEVDYPRRRVHGGISSFGYPQGIAFARDGFGILWENRGTLYVTRDGGRNWSSEPAVARPEVDFGGGAAAFPGGHGLVLLGRGNGSTRLLSTDDGGRTWRTVHRWA